MLYVDLLKLYVIKIIKSFYLYILVCIYEWKFFVILIVCNFNRLIYNINIKSIKFKLSYFYLLVKNSL